ncbi:hypothetical protein D3P07_10605 [Paenibacillus sp. 1011MAR3C5]|uniref:hypothetical protein n=1 Tax=Paenibacillus sp. 1011MAR3C5 TaxID=1675787 RepID=UPI000E6D4100|nr:hypothetical protein [Paenibacillus sp. 1011MAR3C5]RJE88446.1 hypothetical protein D3P07_10605 [Paenibacillus sp. 1011MAR3C5]
MNKYRFLLVLAGMLFLSACGSNEEREQLQTISIKGADNLLIDHGSTALEVESADIESLEATLFMNNNGPGMAHLM